MEQENLSNCEEYDKRYSIHYRCREWMRELVDLLDEADDRKKKKAVLQYYGS